MFARLAQWVVFASLTCGSAAAIQPRFKWAQTKELIFITVMIRDLDKETVNVTTPGTDIEFSGKNVFGELHYLYLTPREDIEKDSLKVEHLARPEKFGTGVLITVTKVHHHRWDLLVPNPKDFKGNMDKDWVREDATLAVDEDSQYLEDNSDVLVGISAKTLIERMKKYKTVIVNVRFPWCTLCRSQDAAFAKAAKLAKSQARKNQKWKKIGWAVLDAREERGMAKQWGATCDSSCEHRVLTSLDEAFFPATLKSKWEGSELLESARIYLDPAVHVLKWPGQVESLRKVNTTCFGSFKSTKGAKYQAFKRAAEYLRGKLLFAAIVDSDDDEETINLWAKGEEEAWEFDGSPGDDITDWGAELIRWVRPRSVPLFQEYSWQLRDVYESLGLPFAKVWFDDKNPDPSTDETARQAIVKIAKKYIGKIAIVEQSVSSYKYELRDYGHQSDGDFPFFGLANSTVYNAPKYSFEVTSRVAPTATEFWSDPVKIEEGLSAFIDQVLAGSWPVAHESGPPQLNWTSGSVKRMVWKTYTEDIQNPTLPVLLEVFGSFREDHEKKVSQSKMLAKAFQKHADLFTIGSYNTAENFLPKEDFERDPYISDTEWYWVPAKPADGSKRPDIVKLSKAAKDVPPKKVIEFAASFLGSSVVAEEVQRTCEQMMVDELPKTSSTDSPANEVEPKTRSQDGAPQEL